MFFRIGQTDQSLERNLAQSKLQLLIGFTLLYSKFTETFNYINRLYYLKPKTVIGSVNPVGSFVLTAIEIHPVEHSSEVNRCAKIENLSAL